MNNYGEDFEIESCTSRTNRAEVIGKEKIVSADRTSFRYRLRLSIEPPAGPAPQASSQDTLTVALTNGTTLQLPCRVFYSDERRPPPHAGLPGR